MSDQELRNYFLANRHDKIALQAHLERRNSKHQKVITKVGDPDFDSKIEKAIQEKLQARQKLK
jgi:hypothetical protein